MALVGDGLRFSIAWVDAKRRGVPFEYERMKESDDDEIQQSTLDPPAMGNKKDRDRDKKKKTGKESSRKEKPRPSKARADKSRHEGDEKKKKKEKK
eukprot:SAG31_NODE_14302_length_815_cov_1.617318_1_plen_95_part_10